MNKQWKRTSFRVRKDVGEKLKSLCERSGYKQKEVLDEVLSRSIASKEIWVKSEPDVINSVYSSWIDLKRSSRTTFEITEENLNGIESIRSNHPDLSRDQILNLMIVRTESSLLFPLKEERLKIAKIEPKLRALVRLKKQIELDLTAGLGADHVALHLITWPQFVGALEHLVAASQKWSGETLFYGPSVGTKPRRSL